MLPSVESLAGVKVVFMAPDTLTLYGIPYQMRADVGQSPRHLWDPVLGVRSEWVYLGEPGWFGHMSHEQVALAQRFIDWLRQHGALPGNPYEWSDVTDLPQFTTS